VEQISTCSPWRTPRWIRWIPEGGCDPTGSLCWSRLLAGPCGERSPCQSRFAGRACDPVGDPCWSSQFLRDCTPWERPTLGQLVKSCSLWQGRTLEQFVEDCLPWEGPHAGAGAECEESSPEEERAAETTCDELTMAPIPRPPVPFRWRRQRKSGVKLSP